MHLFTARNKAGTKRGGTKILMREEEGHPLASPLGAFGGKTAQGGALR